MKKRIRPVRKEAFTKKKSTIKRLFYPTKSRRHSLANIIEMLASSAIIALVVKLSGYSEITRWETFFLTIGAIWLVLLAYLLKGDEP